MTASRPARAFRVALGAGLAVVVALVAFASASALAHTAQPEADGSGISGASPSAQVGEWSVASAARRSSAQAADTAWFAGGCFWCMEPPYDAVEGVISTTSGFMGGTVRNPTYQQVVAGGTGHVEVVQVVFDPARVDYDTLLRIFWVNIDPLDAGGQFCDRGPIYASAIFARNEAQLEAAQTSVARLRQSGRFADPIVTRIREASPFYAAEEYHQGYYRKNPVRYRVYRTSCGRDRRLRELWGDEAGAILLDR